jgi:hypothetical protein
MWKCILIIRCFLLKELVSADKLIGKLQGSVAVLVTEDRSEPGLHLAVVVHASKGYTVWRSMFHN